MAIPIADRLCPQCNSLLSTRSQRRAKGIVVFCMGKCGWAIGVDARILKKLAVQLYKELQDGRHIKLV